MASHSSEARAINLSQACLMYQIFRPEYTRLYHTQSLAFFILLWSFSVFWIFFMHSPWCSVSGIWYDVVLNNPSPNKPLCCCINGGVSWSWKKTCLNCLLLLLCGLLGDTYCSCSATGQHDTRRARFRFAIIIGPEEATWLKQLPTALGLH